MKKVLVTGGSGLLGANLLQDWRKKFSLYAVQKTHKSGFGFCKQTLLDLSDRHNTIEFIGKVKPDAIVHTAAMADVDYCEAHPSEAFKANAEASKNVAEGAESAKAKMIYISTDSVFDGTKGNYMEEDKPNPLNAYAESKLEGEKVVMEKNSNYAIVRTNIFGWNMQKKQCFSEWVYAGIKSGKRLNLFKDVYFTPILVNNLGRALAELVENDFNGLINIAGSERLSKLCFGETLAEVFGLSKENIVPASINGARLAAKRPLDPSLSIKKAQRALETELLDAKSGLEEKKALLESGFVKMLKSGYK